MAKRTLQVEIVGDSRSLERALGKSNRSMSQLGNQTARHTGVMSRGFKSAAKAALGLAAGYASISAAKGAIVATEDLATATKKLHDSLGLSVKMSSEWAAVLHVRGVESKAAVSSFSTLIKSVDSATSGFEKQKGSLKALSVTHQEHLRKLALLGTGQADVTKRGAALATIEKDALTRGKLLTTGAGKQAEAFKSLGVSQKDLKASQNDLTKLLPQVAEGFRKMGDGPKSASVALKLFGKGGQTLVPILRDGAKEMNAQLQLANKYGATFGGKTLKSVNDLIKAQREAKFATLGLQVAFATAVAPALTKAIGKVTTFVAQMRTGTGDAGKFNEILKSIAASVRSTAEAMVPAILAVVRFGQQHQELTKIVGVFGVLAATVKGLKFGAALVGLTDVTGAVGTLNKAMKKLAATEAGASALSSVSGGRLGKGAKEASLAGKVAAGAGVAEGAAAGGITLAGAAPVVAGAAAIGGAGFLIYKNWDKIKPLFASLKGPINQMVAAFQGALPALRNIATAASAVFEHGVVPVLRRVLPGIIGMIKGFVQTVTGVVQVFSGIFTGNFSKAWQGVKNIFAGNLKIIVGQLRAVTAPMRAAAAAIGTAISGAIGGAFNALKSIIRRGVSFMLTAFSSLLGAISKSLGVMAKIPIIGRLYKGLKSGVDEAKNAVDGLNRKINATPNKKVKITVQVDAAVSRVNEVNQLIRNLTGQSTSGALQGGGGGQRRGGRVFRGGGLVPSMLSPGELGIMPNGGSFVVPGSRVAADTVPMALPPDTEIFTGSGIGMLAAGASRDEALRYQRPHFAGGGRVPKGKYEATAYGPPWGGIEGSGVTATGVNLKSGPRKYIVAVDPSVIPLHSKFPVWPNPFGYRGNFSAEDTGGAIKGRRLDFYDWLKRDHQNKWGRRSVTVGAAVKGKGAGGSSGYSYLKAPAITHPLLANDLKPLVDDALLGGITAGMEGTSRLGVLNSVLEGVAPDQSDYPSKVTVSGSRGASGAQGGLPARVAKMQAFGNRVSKKQLAYLWGGYGQGGRYDCSGLVSRMLNYGGFMAGRRDTVGLRSAGVPGAGKFVTWGVRGGAGRSGHTMIKVGSQYFEAGGNRPTGRRSGWNGAFDKYHPKGFREGGVVGGIPVASGARGRLQALLAAGASTDPKSPKFVGWGLRAGGTVQRMRPGGTLVRRTRALQGSYGKRRRPRGITEGRRWANLLGLIGGTPGPDRAQSALINFQQRTKRASERRLLAERRKIRHRIKQLHAHGTTGQERTQIKRLRGAESFTDDELGRRIGYPLGASDAAQADVDHTDSTFEDRMAIQGVEEGSPEYIAEKRAEDVAARQKLLNVQAGNVKALARARRTGNKAAIKLAQDELIENNDRIQHLTAQIATLDKSVKENTETNVAEAMKANTDAMNELAAQVKQQNEYANAVQSLTTAAATKTLADMISGQIGPNVSLQTQSAGSGDVAKRY